MNGLGLARQSNVYCVALMLLVMLLILQGMLHTPTSISTTGEPEKSTQRPNIFICGRFGGTYVAVGESYISKQAEYSDFNISGALKLRQREQCQAKLKGLSLALTWPTMAPAGKEYSREGVDFRGLEVLLSRRTPSGSSRPKAMVDDYLMSSHERIRDNAAFYPSLGLFGATENKGLSKGGSSMFWGGPDARVDVVFICDWERSDHMAPRCTGTFLIPALALKIQVKMAPERLPEWREVVQKVTTFVVAHGRVDNA